MIENSYKTQFQKENIIALKAHISREINNYAVNDTETGKLDVFLILASLSQCAYEVVLNTFSREEDQALRDVDAMKVLVDKFIMEADKTGQEINMNASSKLLASIHLTSLMSEFYSRQRDRVIEKLIKEDAEKEHA